MIKRVSAFLAAAIVLPLSLPAQSPNLSKLPDWAKQAVLASRAAKTPESAEAWVLLDRTEFAYTGNGEVREHHYRVVQVLGERGVNEAVYRIEGLGAGATKVKKLKGWNLRPDGDLEKLDSDDVASLEGQVGDDGMVSAAMTTAAVLPRAVKGSILAFESLEVLHMPMGPVGGTSPMEDIPVLRWEFSAAKKEGWFTDLKQVALKLDPIHFDGWGFQVQQGEDHLSATNIPAQPKEEAYRPDASDIEPWVAFRFLDPTLAGVPDCSSWNSFASYTSRAFGKLGTASLPPLDGADPSAKLDALAQWMFGALTYHAVYLSPSRGWVPEKPEETERKRYGDCKDFSAFLISGAKQIGFDGVPVLARINEGSVDPSLPPGPWFNHVISAIKLDKSLGLPSEVQTEAGRFLLVDPTDHYTPVGQLGVQHRDRWVMLCLPDKAIWVHVPDTAITPAALHFALKGGLDAKGLFRGTLRIEESGNVWGLRQSAVESTTKDFLKRLHSGPLALSAASSCEVVSQSAARDLTKPFVVELKLSTPDAWTYDGSEADLDLPGVPQVPSRITRTGEPRHYPLKQNDALHVIYEASIDLPFPVRPILPSMTSTTCCHAFTWKAVATGSHLELTLDSRTTSAKFGFKDLMEGVQAFRQDRAALLRLNQDGFAFKVTP